MRLPAKHFILVALLSFLSDVVVWLGPESAHFLVRWIIVVVLATALVAMLRGRRPLGSGLLAGQLAFLAYLTMGGL